MKSSVHSISNDNIVTRRYTTQILILIHLMFIVLNFIKQQNAHLPRAQMSFLLTRSPKSKEIFNDIKDKKAANSHNLFFVVYIAYTKQCLQTDKNYYCTDILYLSLTLLSGKETAGRLDLLRTSRLVIFLI